MSNDSERVPRNLKLSNLLEFEVDDKGRISIYTEYDSALTNMNKDEVAKLRDWLVSLHLEEEGMQL